LAAAGVAERGSWVKQLARAYNEYKKGDMDGALIDYIYLAELGYVHLHSYRTSLLGGKGTDTACSVDKPVVGASPSLHRTSSLILCFPF
jgi:hypothetical protein